MIGSVENKEFEYQSTQGIPICPYCKKPTRRRGGGKLYEPEYDERGNAILRYYWYCLECKKGYEVVNDESGAYYLTYYNDTG